jgi:ApaG protein
VARQHLRGTVPAEAIHFRSLAGLRRVPENRVMADKNPHEITVAVQTRFLSEQSAPDAGRYVFAYTIRIANAGSVAARLISRHWIITDANGKVEEVRGDGVVGEQPWLRPGEDFHYTSGAVLETPVGTMRGSYHMLADDGSHFDANIPQFTLSVPRTVH